MADEGKKVGLIGGLLAAIGAAVSHGADDCARAGMHAGSVADDLARPAAHATPIAAGELANPGARAVGGVGDDLARPGSRVLAQGDDLASGASRRPSVLMAPDEALAGGRASDDLAQTLAEHSLDAADLLLDVGSSGDEDGDESEESGAVDDQAGPLPKPVRPSTRLDVLLPELMAVVPISEGKILTSPRLREMLVASQTELGSKLAEKALGRPTFVLGYSAPEQRDTLAMPDGGPPLPVAAIQRGCAKAGRSCIVLVCETPDSGAPKPCVVGAFRGLEKSFRAGDLETDLLRRLLAIRNQSLPTLTIHRIAATTNGPRLVHSRAAP
jgi:hypothetical protein